MVKFINNDFDIIIFYGGNNESIQYLQYETRPSYPYNYFIKNDISICIFKMFLIKYSSIFGIIENKTGIISGINLKRKEISSNFETWSNFHPSHFNLETSLALIKKFKPQKAILTNLSPVLDYKELKKIIPQNVIPAHDGLTINL